jgi:hypothetical protein
MLSSRELSGTDFFVRRPEVDSNALPDRTIMLFQRDTGLAIPVNQAGAAIWAMCDGEHTINQMVDKLAEIYDEDRGRIEEDARAFLCEMVQLGLVDPGLERC